MAASPRKEERMTPASVTPGCFEFSYYSVIFNFQLGVFFYGCIYIYLSMVMVLVVFVIFFVVLKRLRKLQWG